MPKSKKSKLVSLTKVKANRKDQKRGLVTGLQEALDSYKFAFVVGFENMRSGPFKELRQEWADSRFFLGKNRVMHIALVENGEAYRPGLDAVADDLQGQVGLLLTNRPPAEVEAFFADYAVDDYARSGFEATETVTIPSGKLEEMPHTMCETLRKLGMPVELKKGVVVNTTAYTICEEGKAITPEQGKLLKLFGKPMATFRIVLLSRWTAEGGQYASMTTEASLRWSQTQKGQHHMGKARSKAGAGGSKRRGAGGGAAGGEELDDDEDDEDGDMSDEEEEA